VYLQFNRNADPVLANPRVRWALARAFDHDRLIHDIQHDLHELPTGFTAPGAKLTPPVDLPSFNPVAARRMLERAGFGKRRPFPRLEVTYMDQGRENVAVDAIITDWRTHLGIEAYGRAQDGKGLIERNRRGEVSLFFTGWNGDYPDDDNFLPMLFRSNSPENHSGFGDPEVDRLLDLSDRTADEAVRTDLLGQAHTKIAADLPILPLFITREPELLNPRWINLPFGMFGHLDFSQLKKVPAKRS
jgi:ABC-type oligopeptide transport system substrate-binding subunit